MKFLSQINVNTEYTLPIVDGTNGQVLTTDGSGAVYWGSVSIGALNLDGLQDVVITTPTSGQILRYGIPLGSQDPNPVWYNWSPNYLTPSSSIDNLGDVAITSVTAGQLLQWNGSAWVNATLSTVDYVSKVQHTVKAGVAISKGQAVYVTTSDGTNMVVGLASNASEATSSKVIGLAASNAAINDQIFVVTEGLIAGLNTSTATAGDPVWLGTNGNLIFGLLNKPVAPAHLVYIGVVTRVQQNNGEIFVNVQNGFELNEIHDALIVSPTAGQLLRRDSDNLWKNWTPNYLTAEADTLATVTARGATTTGNITVNGAAFATSFSATGLLITNADTSGSLQPDQGSPANKIYSFRWAGNEQGYIDTDAKITFAGFKTPTGTSAQFLKADGSVDSSTYITSSALSGYATQTWVNANFYNQGQIDDFFYGNEPILGYNKTNWDAAYNDKVNSASFNTTNGILTLTQQDGGTVTVDLDGRYLTSDTDAQTLTWDAGSKTLGITNGNDVILSELATEDYVLSQGFISSEADTLSTVVSRGNSTSTNIRVKRPSNKIDNNGNPIEFGGRVEFNNDFVAGQSGYMVFRYPTYNNFLIGGDYDGNIGGAIPNIQFGRAGGDVYLHVGSNGNVGVRTTGPSYPFEIGAIGADSVAAKLTQTYERVRYNGFDLLGYDDGHLWMIGNNNPSLVISSSWDWDRQVEINYTPGPSGGASGVLKIGQLTGQKNSSTYTHGRTEFYVNGAVRSNINTYGVGIGREAASNQKLAIDAATGTWILDAYNSGTEIGGIHVNSGILTLQGSGSTEVRLATSGNATWNGDVLATRTWVQAQGYLTSETDSQTLDWDGASKNLSITNGNTVTLDGLATEEFVTSQGYITGYTETDTLATVTGRGNSTSTSLYLTGGSGEVPALHIRSGGSSWSEGLAIHPSTDSGYGLTFYRTRAAYTDQTNTWAIGNLGDSNALNHFGLLRRGLTGGIADRAADAIFTVNPTGTFKFGFNPYVGTNAIWHAGNDGSGSGLDADLLDGNHASAFALSGHTHIISTIDETAVPPAGVSIQSGPGSGNAQGWAHPYGTRLSAIVSGGRSFEIMSTTYPNGELAMRTLDGSNIWDEWKIMLDANNYSSYAATRTGGNTSGTWPISITGNADTIDGYHETSLVKQDYIYTSAYNWNTVGAAGTTSAIVLRVESAVLNPPANDVYNWSLWQQGNTTRGSQIAVSAYGTQRMYFRGANFDTGSYQTWAEVIHSKNIGSQSVAYATSSGNSVSTDQTNFSELFIEGNAVATKEYVTSQGYLTSLPSHNHDDRYYTESESDARYPLSRGVIGTTSNVGDATGFGNNLASGTYTRNYTGHSGQVWMSHDTGGSVGNFAIEVTYFGSMYIHTNVDSASWSTKQIWTSENFSSTNVTNWNTAYGWGNHADAPYWNVELTDDVSVSASSVRFGGNVRVDGDLEVLGTITETSSIRFKENITQLDPALDKVNQLEAVSYNKIGVDDREIGLIAEDVAELFPEVVTYNEEGAPMGVQYQRLSVILLKAMQEQNAVIAALTERVNKLENK